ncbi:MAG TPA: arginine--tRNA ligase, partial [Roseiarcus sp.]|nr:arginine--tRNA ligase [Roseiarcus sp.]
MNIFVDFQRRIATLLKGAVAAGGLPDTIDLERFVVEPPREAAHGDLSTNAAMVYAKEAKAAGSNSRVLATEIAAGLAEEEDVDQVEVAGPGFISIRLKPVVYQDVLRSVLKEGARFGAAAPSGEPINVEYVSANPT